MPPRNLVRSFVLLWWTLGIAIGVMSVRTLQHAVTGGRVLDLHVALLALVELAAALVFLVPRTLRAGAGVLLAVLAVAFLMHAANHEVRWDFLIYAAAVLFVGVHGPLTKAQWGVAAGKSA